MRVRIIAGLLALIPLTSVLEAGVWDSFKGLFSTTKEQTPVKVSALIVHGKPGVIIEIKGKYSLYDPYKNEHISSRFLGKRKFMQALKDGLTWGEEFPGIHQLLIVPDDKSVTSIVDGVEYCGSLYVYDVEGNLGVVNEIEIEDYLHSVLSSQFQDSMSEEALAAVAIAARTNIYYAVKNPQNKYWVIDGQKAGYQGYSVIDPDNRVGKAVAATRHMILSRSEARLDDAVPFITRWPSGATEKAGDGQVVAAISLADAEKMAQTGAHAAQILAKAFPNATIKLIQR